MYLEYGLFRGRLGQPADARAYLEGARNPHPSRARAVERSRVEAELDKLSA